MSNHLIYKQWSYENKINLTNAVDVTNALNRSNDRLASHKRNLFTSNHLESIFLCSFDALDYQLSIKFINSLEVFINQDRGFCILATSAMARILYCVCTSCTEWLFNRIRYNFLKEPNAFLTASRYLFIYYT